MEKILEEFCEQARTQLGDNLVSVILFGSAAKNAYSEKGSDLNVLVVVREFRLEMLEPLEKYLERARVKSKLIPVFWTEREWNGSWDVFPIEFTDLKTNYKVLHGPDLPSKIQVDSKNLRHQLEFEFRSKVLRLRNEWLHIKGDEALVSRFLAVAGASFLHLFYELRKLKPELDPAIAEPFRLCARLKKGELKLPIRELESLYRQAHNAAGLVLEILN